MTISRIQLLKRQISDNGDDNLDDDGNWWWYSPTAYAIKWAVVGSIFVLFLVYFVGGYIHARKRMARGQPPLPYHRWLVPQRQRAAFVQQHPQHQNAFSFYRAAQAPAYPMGNYGPPPPGYHEPDYLPAYAPPAGSSKVKPDQNYTAPPSGPPPEAAQSNEYLTPNGGPSQPPRAASPGRRD